MTTAARHKTGGAFLLLPLLLVLLCSQTMVAAFHVHHQFRAMLAPSSTLTPDSSSSFPLGGRPTRADTQVSMGFSLFSFGQKKVGKKADVAAALSAELFSMLSDKENKPADAAVMEKIEELEATPGVTFNADYLYDGPWRVLWKTNTAWQKYFDPLNNVADNRAYQWYKKDGSVTNIAQAVGNKLYVTVDGQGAPASQSKQLPYEVNVEVSRAWLHALGRKVPLDFIKGKGTTFVVYNDAKLRVFRSDTGGVVVQTKADEEVLV